MERDAQLVLSIFKCFTIYFNGTSQKGVQYSIIYGHKSKKRAVPRYGTNRLLTVLLLLIANVQKSVGGLNIMRICHLPQTMEWTSNREMFGHSKTIWPWIGLGKNKKGNLKQETGIVYY